LNQSEALLRVDERLASRRPHDVFWVKLTCLHTVVLVEPTVTYADLRREGIERIR